MNSRNVSGHIIIAIFSFLAAFFGVFQVLFTDANGVKERAGAVTLVLIVYTVLSLAAHLLWPIKGWAWVRWLATPALLLGGFYLFQEFSSLSMYGILILLAAVGGATFGREVMSRKRNRATPPIQP